MKKLSFVTLLFFFLIITACITGKNKSQGTNTNSDAPKSVVNQETRPRKMTQAQAEAEAQANPTVQQQNMMLNKKDLPKKKLPTGNWETSTIIPLKDTIK